jgi:hypothetical protein
MIIAALAPPRQSESLARSPFDELRWVGEHPQTEIDGRWSAVTAIDGVEIERVLGACRELNERYWRKKFEEELVAALTKCGRAPGPTVTLRLRGVEGDVEQTLAGVRMTAANVVALRAAHNALHGEPPAIPRASREHANQVAPQFGELAHPLRFELEPDTQLSRQDAEADLDQLEWLIENRFAFRDFVALDRKALFDAVRVGLGESLTRNQFALQLAKLLARFGDADTRLAGELALPSGWLPCLLGETCDGILAYEPDRSGFVDAQHPYVTRIDGIDVAKWIEVAGRIAPGGAPQLVRHDTIRQLARIAWLREEMCSIASTVVRLELQSLDRSNVKTVELDLSDTRARELDPERAAPHRIERRFGYLRLGFPPGVDSDDLWPDGLGIGGLMNTDGLVVDARGITNVSRDAVRLFMTTLMRMDDEPRVLEVAYYRTEPGAESSYWYAPLNRRSLDALGPSADLRDRNAAEEDRQHFVGSWPARIADFSPSHWLVTSRWEDAYPLHYAKPVVLLCDARSTEATEVAVEALKGWRDCKVIGTATGGANGWRLPFRLERSGLVVNLSTVVAFRHNGELFTFHGVEPDVHVDPLATDFIGATDTQLAAALDYLRSVSPQSR